MQPSPKAARLRSWPLRPYMRHRRSRSGRYAASVNGTIIFCGITVSISSPGAGAVNVRAGRWTAVGLAVTGATRLALTASSKLSTRAAGRAATTPWLLAADAAQMIVESTARSLGREKKEARRAGQAVGAGASAGIGALTGGPAGAAVAVGLWAVGEAVGKALLSGQRRGKGVPGRPNSRLRGNEGHIHDTRTPGVYQR